MTTLCVPSFQILWTITMGSKGGFILPVLLLILAALCHSGHSLTCYSCPESEYICNNTISCGINLDACLFIKADPLRYYYQCWRQKDCNYQYISNSFQIKKLEYYCCQKDLCNGSAGMSASRKTALLVTPLLAVAWTLYL
uniref:MAC-inhibitory protein n=2 Tax=Canis lupus familiaris TaxID=9615 RepID=A0A8C0P373_CANLF